MDYKNMETTALEERKAEILRASQEEGCTLEELRSYEAQLIEINAELEARKANEAERRAVAERIASGAGETISKLKQEERKTMTNMEIRNTKPYIDAFAEYIKSQDDSECRALLTENVSGTVPVPEFVYDVVKTAWEKDDITKRVKKTYMKGNLKVGFEISGSDATKHTEGTAAVSEESLTLGVVKLIPASIKKWISISDEVYDMRGEDFLRYIYAELTYRIAKAAANDLLDKIIACGTTATTTQVSVGKVTATQISVGLVAQALGYLSDEANDPVIIMNKRTWSAFKEAQYANKYAVDPFEGLPVAFSNHLTAFSAATTGVPYMIVGDLGNGALANFPNGDEIKFKFDDITGMAGDLVKILGREYVAIEPIACDAFVKVCH